MGTCMAPSYANFFMGHLEQLLLGSYPSPTFAWWRYIDHVFAIWTHGVPLLKSFLDHINSYMYHPSITFTMTCSPMSVSFLDTKVTLKDGHIQTDHFCKSTDKHQYFHWNSCHTRHNKTSIPLQPGSPPPKDLLPEVRLQTTNTRTPSKPTKAGFPTTPDSPSHPKGLHQNPR